jgi:hypothetical protein
MQLYTDNNTNERWRRQRHRLTCGAGWRLGRAGVEELDDDQLLLGVTLTHDPGEHVTLVAFLAR